MSQITDIITPGIPGPPGLPATGAAEDAAAVAAMLSIAGAPRNAVDARITLRLETPLGDLDQAEEDIEDLRAQLAARRTLGLIPAVSSSAERDTLYPPSEVAQGDKVDRLDKGYVERYYAAYNAVTNPGGASPAGWYPAPGAAIVGRIAKNNGFQTIAAAPTVTLVDGMVAQDLLGGFTAVGGRLIVPASGVYRAVVRIYGSGPSLNLLIGSGSTSVAFDSNAPRVMLKRTEADSDEDKEATRSMYLSAGDQLGLVAQVIGGTAVVHGGSDLIGCALQLDYIGPRQA